jgi:hypothetical protein
VWSRFGDGVQNVELGVEFADAATFCTYAVQNVEGGRRTRCEFDVLHPLRANADHTRTLPLNASS